MQQPIKKDWENQTSACCNLAVGNVHVHLLKTFGALWKGNLVGTRDRYNLYAEVDYMYISTLNYILLVKHFKVEPCIVYVLWDLLCIDRLCMIKVLANL